MELIFRQNDSLMICGHNSFYSSPVFRSDIQLSAEILPLVQRQGHLRLGQQQMGNLIFKSAVQQLFQSSSQCFSPYFI